MRRLEKKKIVFFGGKGGVGKSTISAAYARNQAQSGKETLLVSTDPAHNTGDIFSRTIGDHITRIEAGLSALEINPEKEAAQYIEQVKNNLKGLVRANRVEEVHRHIDAAAASPGAEEAALFDRIVSLILDEQKRYDKIVFDTAPTGHTIRLLVLPELMSVWIEGMISRREKYRKDYVRWLGEGEAEDDPIYDILNERRRRFAEVRDILLDHQTVGFAFVLNPEQLPVLETKKAVETLERHHLHTDTIIVNKVLPREADGAFLQKRKAREKVYLEKINHDFSKYERVEVPLLPEDVTSVKGLEHISASLRKTTSSSFD